MRNPVVFRARLLALEARDVFEHHVLALSHRARCDRLKHANDLLVEADLGLTLLVEQDLEAEDASIHGPKASCLRDTSGSTKRLSIS